MDRLSTERIDAYPYRHRLVEVMGAPVVSVSAETTLAEAARRMLETNVSSLLLLDAGGRPDAIFTEHDLLAAIAERGPGALDDRIDRHASRPVEQLPTDAYVFRALGRMDRLGIRHLAVVDPENGRAVGVVSARGLLKQRAGRALAIGDSIAVAQSGEQLATAQAELPALAGALVAEGIDARSIADMISAVVRDVSARAAELAAASLIAEGKPAPARWCYLVLGSGGRGESQLIPDQDNALVHDGAETDDAWFAELGRRASDILATAGIPYCKGKVMASNGAWRGNLAQWRQRIAGWIETPSPEDLLSVDIFYDFQPVFGDRSLADALRDHATQAGTSRPFLIALSHELADTNAAIGFFGNLRTEQGRLDLKRHGLLPIVAGARLLALRLGARATSTVDRLRAAQAAGIVTASDAATLERAQALFLTRIFEQQSLDVEAGLAPTVRVDIARLTSRQRRELKAALRDVALVGPVVKNALTAGA
jgi:CBS domain-containing protein